MRDVMARRRETLTQYNASTWQEVDAAIINETNKGSAPTSPSTLSDWA